MIDIHWLMETAMVISEKPISRDRTGKPTYFSVPTWWWRDRAIRQPSGKPVAAAINREVSDQSITSSYTPSHFGLVTAVESSALHKLLINFN
jgi:hypothetical protein